MEKNKQETKKKFFQKYQSHEKKHFDCFWPNRKKKKKRRKNMQSELLQLLHLFLKLWFSVLFTFFLFSTVSSSHKISFFTNIIFFIYYHFLDLFRLRKKYITIWFSHLFQCLSFPFCFSFSIFIFIYIFFLFSSEVSKQESENK